MTIRHDNEKAQFKKLFKQQGLDQFNNRFKVLEMFLQTDEHITSKDLTKQLEQDGESFEENFIAGTMELLCKYGFASKIEFNNGTPRFEHRHLGLHHDHMICTKCGKIIEFRDEELENNQSKMAQAYGFHMLQHKMEIYGICSECLRQRNLVISLDHIKQGEKVVVVGFEGGQKIAERLSSMGIRKGATIEIVTTQAGGQIVAAVEESRFVIGRGMATKVMVQSADKPGAAILDNKIKKTSDDINNLSNVKQGQECIISKISGEPKLRRRLLEMGINRGAKIYIEKYAPLKDPLELIVKGSHISLRVEEAAHINVEDVRNSKTDD
ncbi:MAG: FeoA domain-containing protein [Desulfobacteraceae bacterium]|nr:FeoA domain-containing protein [Desulfobacteraceae bacterium]